ncbi:Uncharacterised protein [Serratia proteamaculans]|uniref:tail fiber/spike domain-containing protein n=1 Tax=Serratia proteamaculans TaxID=28151 RepID=UPI0021780575|nr:hypothetical protein [Serratia proteamaculans]CAI0806782.1 Uncharacterised protein [Serratia proteamaculans]CAI1594432.1 Uncharacterised protein [Serratia proteamaculans]
MSDINKAPEWEQSINLISRAEKVLGGKDGASNRPIKQLESRTDFLKGKTEEIDDALSGKVSANKYFTDGAIIESPLDEVIHGNYRLVWTGVLPKVIPPFSAPETTGGIGAGAWAYTSDAPLRQSLARGGRNTGGNMVALERGGTVGDAIKHVSIFAEGARGDYNPETGIGTNDLPAIINAVEKAKENGCLEVHVPAGYDYFLDRTQSGPINLGGIDFEGDNSQAGARGVRLVSVGQGLARFFVKSPEAETTCIVNTGGSGSFTSRGIDGITFIAHPSSRGMGIAYENRDSCGTLSYNCIATDMYAAVMFHNKREKSFTEFNRFIGWRLHNCRHSAIFKITDGDNSFHGTEFISCQMQMYIDPVNPINSGSGMKSDIPAGRRGHIYHSRFDIRAFGGPGCKLLDIENLTCDNSFGTMTCEGDFILKCTDDSWWHVHGDLIYYNGTMTIDAPVPPRLGVPATFIFSNRGGPFGNFTDPTMADCKPALYDPNAADRMINGSFPYMGRVRGPGTDSLFVAIREEDAKGFNFLTVPDNGRLEDAIRRWGFDSRGSSLKGYANVVYLNNLTTGVMVTPTGFTNRISKELDCGTPAYPWRGGYFQNAPTTVSDGTLKYGKRVFNEQEILAYYFIGELPGFWKWIARVEEEGDEARWHAGPIVQECIAIFDKYVGKDEWKKYGSFGHDAWPEEQEIWREWEAEDEVSVNKPARAAVVENGVIVSEAEPEKKLIIKERIEAGRELIQEYRPAGAEYRLRITELLWSVHYATATVMKKAIKSMGAHLPEPDDEIKDLLS